MSYRSPKRGEVERTLGLPENATCVPVRAPAVARFQPHIYLGIHNNYRVREAATDLHVKRKQCLEKRRPLALVL